MTHQYSYVENIEKLNPVEVTPSVRGLIVEQRETLEELYQWDKNRLITTLTMRKRGAMQGPSMILKKGELV